ncbi:MAG TPA: hypothetical protein VHU40_02350, partial [Polyangia bacterium]|nr:hypothetical protein [Polyangia bacterium]
MPMKRLARILSGACLLAAPTLSSAHAAVTIVVQHGKSPPSTIYADGDHLRMDLNHETGAALGKPGESGSTGFIVIDAAARKMMMVQDRDKTYTEMTEEDMNRAKAQMQAVRGQLAERMKNATPEQRARFEAMMGPAGAAGMGDQKPHEWKFEPLGQKKTVNGFACQMYRGLLDGKPHEEDCISPWSAGLVKRADFAGLEKFGESINQGLGIARGAGGMPLFHQYPGFPISRVVLDAAGARGEEQQVKSIKQGALAPGLFAAPAGYTQRKPFEGAGHGMPGHPPAG